MKPYGAANGAFLSDKESTVMDAVLVSDLHLGAESSQVQKFQEFLSELPLTSRLVLNGDVLESTEYRLTKQHWRILSSLRKLSDQLELIWVRGNHDSDAEAVAHLIGAKFVSEYAFESGGRRILCVHGDTWDHFITDHPIITIVADWFYLRMQRMSRKLAATAKRSSKTFLRCVDRVRTGALGFAQSQKADVVICGHTHHPEAVDEPYSHAPAYFNSGSWTDVDCTYLTVDDGVVRLEALGVNDAELAFVAA
ncbi:MAG: UDP-2,3-diacylglucosamine diphosphatase [Acidobacteria bacterium]|nr:MAG: UDP-2,3-diacylglucosamine diphosphatase [Acidobacteriota bacterium]